MARNENEGIWKFLGIVGSCAGIVSIILSVHTYQALQKVKSPRNVARPSESEAQPPQADALGLSLARLENRLSAVERIAARGFINAPGVPGGPGEEEQAGDPGAAPVPEEPALPGENRDATKIEKTMRTEPPDYAWASEVEQNIATAISTGNYAGVVFEEATCRSTTCKAELKFANAEAFEAFADRFPAEFPGYKHLAFQEDLDAERLPGDPTVPMSLLIVIR